MGISALAGTQAHKRKQVSHGRQRHAQLPCADCEADAGKMDPSWSSPRKDVYLNVVPGSGGSPVWKDVGRKLYLMNYAGIEAKAKEIHICTLPQEKVIIRVPITQPVRQV